MAEDSEHKKMDALDDRWVLDCEQTQEEESEIVPESD